MPSFYFTPDEMCTTLKLEMKRIHDFFMANGWKPAPGAFEADVVLCATCSGWSKLERNSLARVRRLLSRTYPALSSVWAAPTK